MGRTRHRRARANGRRDHHRRRPLLLDVRRHRHRRGRSDLSLPMARRDGCRLCSRRGRDARRTTRLGAHLTFSAIAPARHARNEAGPPIAEWCDAQLPHGTDADIRRLLSQRRIRRGSGARTRTAHRGNSLRRAVARRKSASMRRRLAWCGCRHSSSVRLTVAGKRRRVCLIRATRTRSRTGVAQVRLGQRIDRARMGGGRHRRDATWIQHGRAEACRRRLSSGVDRCWAG